MNEMETKNREYFCTGYVNEKECADYGVVCEKLRRAMEGK